MARLARIAFLATLLVAALALAACGDDNTEKNAYIRELTAAQTQYQTKAKRIEEGATPTSTPRQDRRTLGRFSAAIARRDRRAARDRAAAGGLLPSTRRSSTCS